MEEIRRTTTVLGRDVGANITKLRREMKGIKGEIRNIIAEMSQNNDEVKNMREDIKGRRKNGQK